METRIHSKEWKLFGIAAGGRRKEFSEVDILFDDLRQSVSKRWSKRDASSKNRI